MLVSIALAASASADALLMRTTPIIGGGRDAMGCVLAGGYRWCQKEGKCVRSWELARKRRIAPERVSAYCGPTRRRPGPIGGDTDAYGCKPSAGYRWCAREGKCVRPWELARKRGIDGSKVSAYCAKRRAPSPTPRPDTPRPVGGDRDEGGCLVGAGYKWCAREGKCARPWELAREKGFEGIEGFRAYCGGRRR
jgi:hypothetical protein